MKHQTPWACAGVLLVGLAAALAGEPADAPPPAKVLKQTHRKPALKGTMEQALRKWQKLTGLKVVVDWEGIEDTGVRRDDTVSIAVDRATGEQLLDLILTGVARKAKPLGWFCADGTVHVTTQIKVLNRDRLVVRAAPGRRGRAARPRRPRPSRRRPGNIREITFTKTPLSEVIDFFRTLSGLNIHVNWRSLEAIGVDVKTPVTLKVANVSLGKALDLVGDAVSGDRLRFERVYWVVEDNVVTIATGTALNQTLRTKVIEVGDLLMPIPDFKAPRISLTRSERTGTGDDDDSDGFEGLFEDDEDEDDAEEDDYAERRRRLAKELIGAIKDSIGSEMWQPEGKGSIRLHGSKLIISQTPLGFRLLREAGRRR
jgi:hypothetical protein